MKTGNAPPDIDPSNNHTLAGTLDFAFKKMMQYKDGCLPAKVIKYDRANNRVQVQLLIAMVTTLGEQISRQQIASIPVLVLGGGGYMLNFNLVEGDLGWVVANDRDISLFLQSYAESPPNTYRMFNFADGLFIPDIMKGYTINPEDNESAVLQSTDGLITIALRPEGIKIKNPLTLIDGNLTVTGVINATGGLTVAGGTGGTINVTGDVNMTGELAVIGDITATGDITPHI